jgi:predicted nucleic acid-binding protein
VIEFVIDASAILELITGSAPDRRLRRTALTQQGAAPELIDLEAASMIRRTVLAGHVHPDVGRARLQDISETPITRTSHRPLLSRVWELRHAISAYDAAYVALAERFDVPLLTCDARLGGSNGHRAEIIVYPRS